MFRAWQRASTASLVAPRRLPSATSEASSFVAADISSIGASAISTEKSSASSSLSSTARKAEVSTTMAEEVIQIGRPWSS